MIWVILVIVLIIFLFLLIACTWAAIELGLSEYRARDKSTCKNYGRIKPRL